VSDAFFPALAREAAARYDRRDRFARHFARGKLNGDPAFRGLLARGLIPRGARVLDLGCGQGVLAAILLAARASHGRGQWPGDWPAPPNPREIRGIDSSRRDIDRATAALPEARFECADIREARFGEADAVAILDVLHYLGVDAQRDVLERVRDALRGGGVLLLRVADADGSLRFRYTVFIDHAATMLRGHGIERFHCRPVAQWKRLLESLGFRVDATAMSEGTAFANVLLVARYDPGATS
jgi:trans-aconitate methyltransferase